MRVGGRGARSQPSVKGRVHATEAAGVWLVTVALKRRHYFVRDIAPSRDPASFDDENCSGCVDPRKGG